MTSSASTTSCPSPEGMERALAAEAADRALIEHLEVCPRCALLAREIQSNNRLLRPFAPVSSSAMGPMIAALDTPEIPGFADLSPIGRGAQGEVYRARQTSTGRTVALKLLRWHDALGPHEHARFEREVRLLAQLSHPNIVTIHDSGEAAGRRFYVMDFVEGVALDEYVRQLLMAEPTHSRVLVRRVVELFVTIADAVNAAHVRGVIHRDLKPGNVRVDLQGQPHVLDFGLAKTHGTVPGQTDASTAMTQTGQFLGSLPWCSPEQAEGRVGDLDTRSDVYSLGVMLYQALTQSFPYPVDQGLRATLEHIVHTPAAPLSRHFRSIDHDVETVVLKCLQKEPARRYQTAGELCRDLQRWQRGAAVEAKANRAAYVLWKTLARRPLVSGLVAALVLVLLTSSILLAGLYHRQLGATVLAEQRRSEAEEATIEAASESRRANAANRILLDALGAVAPDRTRGKEVTVSEYLDQAAAQIDAGALRSVPEDEAEARMVIASMYLSLGRLDGAEGQLGPCIQALRAVHGGKGPRLAVALRLLGSVYQQRGQHDRAEPVFREVLALPAAFNGPDDPSRLDTLVDLANVLHFNGASEECERITDQILAKRPEAAAQSMDPVRMRQIAELLLERNRYAAAEPLLRSAYERTKSASGDDHPDLPLVLERWITVLKSLNRIEEARPLAEESLRIARKVRGPRHVHTAVSLTQVASLAFKVGDYAAAIEPLREALDIQQEALGSEHPYIAECLTYYGVSLAKVGRAEEATVQLREALRLNEQIYGVDSPRSMRPLSALADALLECEGPDSAREALQRARDLVARCARNEKGPVWGLAEAQLVLADALRAAGEVDEASYVLEQALDRLGRSSDVPESVLRRASALRQSLEGR